MTRPILAAEALRNISLAQHMRSFDQPYEYSGCTCSLYDCLPLKRHINYHILLAQWITITLRLERNGSEKDCVPIYARHIEAMNKIFQEKLGDLKKLCPLIGCPSLPMKIIENLESNGKWKICEPVMFDTNESTRTRVQALAETARKSPYI